MKNMKNTEARSQITDHGSLINKNDCVYHEDTKTRRILVNADNLRSSSSVTSVSSVLNPVVAPSSFVSSCLRGESSSSSPLLITHDSLFIEKPARRRAFTLIELLVVISIIAILIAILLPALSGALNAGYSAATQAELGAVKSACLSYYSSFNAYPGPFSEGDISLGNVKVNGEAVTGTQNLLLGLMGTVYPTGKTAPTGVTTVAYSGSTSGISGGVVDLTPGSGPIDYSNNGVQKSAYYNPSSSSGDLQTFPPTAAGATPTQLPTLYDDFPAGVPILYFRKVPGMPGPTGYPVGTDSGTAAAFYLNCNSAYTTPSTTNYVISTKNNSVTSEQYSSYNSTTDASNAVNYFAMAVVNPNALSSGVSLTTANLKGNPVVGGFVLISAGADHIYGQNLNGVAAGQAPASDDVVVYGGQ